MTSWLNPAHLGRLREATGRSSVSVDEMAEMATNSFRSAMGSTTREDSLVLILGLLNLGTVLCYAVYAQIFKPARHSSFPLLDDPQYLYKKVQNIMDELVLHVHTSSYYKRVAEERPANNVVRSLRGRSTERKVSSFFELPDEVGFTGRTASNPKDYQTYLSDQIKKMMKEWLSFLLPAQLDHHMTKRQARTAMFMRRRRPFHNANGTLLHLQYRSQMRQNSSSSLPMKLKSSSSNLQPQMSRPALSSAETDGPVAEAFKPDVSPSESRQQQQHVTVHSEAAAALARIPFPRSDTVNISRRSNGGGGGVGGIAAHRLLDVNRSNKKQPRLESLTGSASQTQPDMQSRSQQRPPYPQQHNQWSAPEETVIGRLMGLIRQTTPLTMDVLGVYDQTNEIFPSSPSAPASKCLERLLCQLNQEWKHQGAVSAALAPFLRYYSNV